MLPGKSPSEKLVSLPRIFASLLVIGFVAELAVMFALPVLMPQAPAHIQAIVDSSLLTMLSAPAIWWLVIRPLRSAGLREKGRAAAVITHAVDGILTLDLDNRIESCNPAGERIFGCAAGDLVGQSILLLVPDMSAGGSADTSVAHMLLNRSAKGDVGIELLTKRRDGIRIPVEFAVSEVQLDHKPTFIVMARDITERKRAEADVLYLSFAKPQRATDSEMRDDGIIVHRRGKKVVGLAIQDASTR